MDPASSAISVADKREVGLPNYNGINKDGKPYNIALLGREQQYKDDTTLCLSEIYTGQSNVSVAGEWDNCH